MHVAREKIQHVRLQGTEQLPNRQGFDALTVQELMQRFHVPGVSIAVIRDFQIHWAKGYGVADVEKHRPVDTNTPFQAASISKPVTAMAAMRLVQEHRLALDADVNATLKSWHIPMSNLTHDQPVTPRALFSHTSGADDGFGFPGYDPTAPRPTVVQILDGQPPSNLGKVLFARPPFQGYKYSGGGILIMQLALAELTGQPFAEFMQSTVLGPLEMINSAYDQPPTPALSERAARAHDHVRELLRRVRRVMSAVDLHYLRVGRHQHVANAIELGRIRRKTLLEDLADSR